MFLQNHVMVWIIKKIYGIESCYDPNKILSALKNIKTVTLNDGSIYKSTKNLWDILAVIGTEYDLSDIKKTDIVLDIGANIGTISIPLAIKAKHIFAVEPLYSEELQENIELNGISNVTVIPGALGDGELTDIKYFDTIKYGIKTYSFKEILVMCGGKIDFLKCDCEGGEWYINANDLDGIRRIEMEIHPTMYPTEKSNPELVHYIKDNWNTTKTVLDTTYNLHAKKIDKS